MSASFVPGKDRTGPLTTEQGLEYQDFRSVGPVAAGRSTEQVERGAWIAPDGLRDRGTSRR